MSAVAIVLTEAELEDRIRCEIERARNSGFLLAPFATGRALQTHIDSRVALALGMPRIVICGVYAIGRTDGLVKIGKSDNVLARFFNLSYDHPGALTLLGLLSENPDDERSFHQQFADQRAGGEWFRSSPDLLSLIRQVNVVVSP